MNKFLKEFKDRGFFYQCTSEEDLSKLLDKEKINGYIGFDCTAESLHVGSLLQIMCLRLLQKYGHRPIVLLGGGTTRIGDPSGKDKTRKILNEKDVFMANPEDVKRITGYTIGGVSPTGHLIKIKIYIDENLRNFKSIFAAAGHPNAVFEIDFKNLKALTSGETKEITE